MSKSPLANTKSALAFAGITIFSTLMMVGPGSGVLDRTMERFGHKSSEPASEDAPIVEQARAKPVAEPLDPDAGWGNTGGSVFGDYASAKVPASEMLPEEGSPEPDSPASPASPAFGQRQVRRISALPEATGGPVKADSLGELVPREGGDEAGRAEAGATSRSISVQPQ
ncbi:MAG: hypothetical protein ACK4IC_09255 [Erythrobacter sp.]